jgi:hypothetical protein
MLSTENIKINEMKQYNTANILLYPEEEQGGKGGTGGGITLHRDL